VLDFKNISVTKRPSIGQALPVSGLQNFKYFVTILVFVTDICTNILHSTRERDGILKSVLLWKEGWRVHFMVELLSKKCGER
jgi:hypothetical protein